MYLSHKADGTIDMTNASCEMGRLQNRCQPDGCDALGVSEENIAIDNSNPDTCVSASTPREGRTTLSWSGGDFRCKGLYEN
jgi:hypothetical protein